MRRAIFVFLLVYACFGQSPLPYQPVADWPRLPPGWNFMETAGVAVDAANHSYVLHRGPHPIMEFEGDGTFVRSWGDGLFVRPHSIRVDAEGNIWTTDDGGHTVLKMNSRGKIIMVLGRFRNSSDMPGMTGPPVGGALRGMRDETVVRFNGPTDSAVAPNGDIFVADGYGNSRVVKFNKEGIFVKEWGKRGSAPGEFNTPHSIVVDKQNRVLVADRENYRIQIFDTDGNFQKEWKDLGSPWGLALTADNHILMADGYNNRVLKLTSDGKIVGSLGSYGTQPGQFHYCHQIAAAPDGSIYTAEILNWRPQKFTSAAPR
jgi:DNA-binding beta-propeller fold protein YncE